MNRQPKNVSPIENTAPELPSPAQMLSVLSSIPHLYSWIYEADGTLLESTCPQEELFCELFTKCGYPEKIREYAKTESAPYALSIYMGLVWYAVLEKNDTTFPREKSPSQQNRPTGLSRIFLLGPVFQYPVSPARLDETLRGYETLGMSLGARRSLIHAMEELPVIPHTQFASYAILLHRCVTGKSVSYPDLNALSDTEPSETQLIACSSVSSSLPPNEALEDFYGGLVKDFSKHPPKISPSVYRLILKTEEAFRAYLDSGIFLPGDASFPDNTSLPDGASFPGGASFPWADPSRKHMAFLPTDISGIRSPLGKTRLSAALLTYFCARTCIESGMSYEKAYRMADEYLGRIETLHSPIGLQKLMGDMMADYRNSLAQHRRNANSPDAPSPKIQLCLDYIHNHLTDPIPLEVLAKQAGSTPYYFSRQFKEAIGLSPAAYIRREKIKYAARLLIATEDSIDEIVRKIALSSRSHFSMEFAKIMGMPPGEYRKKYRG